MRDEPFKSSLAFLINFSQVGIPWLAKAVNGASPTAELKLQVVPQEQMMQVFRPDWGKSVVKADLCDRSHGI